MKKMLFVVEKSNNGQYNNSQEENLIINNRSSNNLNNIINSNFQKNSNQNKNNNPINNTNKKQNNKRKEPKAFLFGDNNIFNNIRNTNTITKFQMNNQILFEHSFINSKTSDYVLFLEEPKVISTIININSLIENRKGFDEFQELFDWEYYELILILASCQMNFEFFDLYNDYIMIYLFNGMQKLGEIKFMENIEKNQKYCFKKLFSEMKYFYDKKEEDFKSNSEEKYSLEQRIDELRFLYICFVYYKLQKGKKLDFTEYKYNKYTIQPLLTALKFKENIIELNLSYNDIGYEGCYCLGNLLRINKNLSVLILSYCKIDNIAVKFLLKGLKYNKDTKDKYFLTQINLSDNNITEDGGEFLGLMLVYFSKLQWFNISNNKINNNGAIKLFEAYNKILTTDNSYNGNINLNISDNNDYNLNINISTNINSNINLLNQNSNNNKNLHSLETLILIGIGIYSEECLSILGNIIKHPKCGLKTLVLSQNKIGNSNPYNLNYFNDLKDVKYLLQCIKENKTIKELLLLSCQIGNDIIEDFYQMLKVNKSIEYLVLYNNNINQQMQFLKLLSLFSDLPENNGQINNYLKVLDLSKNNCSIEINNTFLNIIERLQLTSLDISQNELSREGSENFKTLANRIGDKLKIIY